MQVSAATEGPAKSSHAPNKAWAGNILTLLNATQWNKNAAWPHQMGKHFALNILFFNVEPLFSEHPTLTKLEATPDELASPLVGVPGEMRTRNEGYEVDPVSSFGWNWHCLSAEVCRNFLTKSVNQADRLCAKFWFSKPGMPNDFAESSALFGSTLHSFYPMKRHIAHNSNPWQWSSIHH